MQAHARAVLFDGSGLPFRHVEIPLPPLGDREILVRVLYCTICGSDVHTVAGRRSEPTPCILGHEIIGRIEQFGVAASRSDLRGDPLREGDRITWTSAATCGTCFFCTHDLPQKCERIFKYGHQSIESGHPLGGGLAEYCVLLPGTGIVRLPDDMPDAAACPANCATATIAAALRTAGGCQGKSVLIQGAGMLGLTACAMASVGGASNVICTDVNEERLALASQFGAAHLIRATPDVLRETVATITHGYGVDLALELSGAPSAMELGLELLRIGGTAVWVGAVYPVAPIQIKPEFVVKRWLTLHGVHNYTPADLLSALDFLAAHHRRFPFAQMVTAPGPLGEIDQAFRQAQSSGAVRVAVRPGG